MITIFFFYGLAFVLMGITIMAMSKGRDVLDISGDIWLVGLFGILHGLNEWVDLLILSGDIFNVGVLKSLGGVLLPVSFIFLVIFGGRVISRDVTSLKWVRHLWILCLAAFGATYLFRGSLDGSVAARYFIAFPGAVLAGIALFLRFSRTTKEKEVPFVFSLSIGIAVVLFFLYGVLSGLVTPKTDFLIGSILNYGMFIDIIGIPVQFFRMICAIGLAVSFVVITNVFVSSGRSKNIGFKGGIRKKLVSMFLTISLIVVGVGLFLGYASSYSLVLDLVGAANVEKGTGLAQSVDRIINEEVLDLRTYVTSPLCLKAIKEANARYDNMSVEHVRTSLLEVDKNWAAAGKDSLLSCEYLQNSFSKRLQDIVAVDTGLAEFFVTDKYGGLVASSGKTSDFYQADEVWWKKASERASGDVAVGDIARDESANIFGIMFTLPVYDGEEMIGVCKALLDPDRIFNSLTSHYLAEGSPAFIVDSSGSVIYSQRDRGDLEKYLQNDTLTDLIKRGKKWDTYKREGGGGEEVFFAPVKVDNAYLKEYGVEWWVFIEQSKTEVFRPLSVLLLQGGLLFIVLIPILFFGGDMMGRYFSLSVGKLKKGVDQAAKGDLTARVNIKTGDELEALAVAFNEMVASLKASMVSNDRLETEAKERERVQVVLKKQQVELREYTGKIKQALDAAQRTKRIMISMLEDNNDIRVKLGESFTELQETQSMLVQSEKLVSIGHLVSEMAHEVNNPLMIISARSQLMQMGDLAESDVEDSLAIIEKQCYRARDIIQRLLKFSKPSGTQRENVDINICVEEAAKLLEHQYLLENIELSRDYGTDLPLVSINKNELEEVFLNLMKNSAEAITGGGKISITTSADTKNVRLVFKDTGSGISRKAINKIFDPFFTTKKEGTGLGLSVCYGIIKGHRGILDYESLPGEGTSATITLPIAKKEA